MRVVTLAPPPASIRSFFLIADFEPDFDLNDTTFDHELFDDGAEFEEALVLLFGTESITYSTPAPLYQLRSKITTSLLQADGPGTAVCRFAFSRDPKALARLLFGISGGSPVQ